MNDNYFSWLTENTITEWTNDSALIKDIERAEKMGSIGGTTNPPLSYEALTTETDYYQEKLDKISKDLPDDDYALEAMSLVVKRLSARFMPLHKEKGTIYGCVRAQVAPNLRDNAKAMIEVGKKISSWGENIMVKIPGTGAGIEALEELAALGIPTNPTVVTTVSQAIAAAEAFERGAKRAEAAGLTPKWSTCAIVMGRLQDYLTELVKERNLDLAVEDLEWAALAVVKRSNEIFNERGYKTILQPAAFRAPMQVEQLSGGRFAHTIHPKVQDPILELDKQGKIKREEMVNAPVDQEAVNRVAEAIPEFKQAYDPNGLSVDEFLEYGANKMTLDGFESTGWVKLVSLKKA